jgi:hypothetical protein
MQTTLRMIGLGLACLGLVACDGTAPDAGRTEQLSSRLDALEKRLATTERGVEPVDRLRDDVASLDRRLSSLEAGLRELGNRPAAGTAATPAPTATTPPATVPAGPPPPPRRTPSSGPAAWGPTNRQERTQRRMELRALTDEFRARLAELRQDPNSPPSQEKTREVLDWYREQRRAILRGESRPDQQPQQ